MKLEELQQKFKAELAKEREDMKVAKTKMLHEVQQWKVGPSCS